MGFERTKKLTCNWVEVTEMAISFEKLAPSEIYILF